MYQSFLCDMFLENMLRISLQLFKFTWNLFMNIEYNILNFIHKNLGHTKKGSKFSCILYPLDHS